MHQRFKISYIFKILFCNVMLLNGVCYSKSYDIEKKLNELNLPKKVTQDLTNNIYSNGKVYSLNSDKEQNLKLVLVGLHEKRCSIALSKTSQYERYKEFLDIVKVSRYNESNEQIYLKIDHLLMPSEMILDFKIERIYKPGAYKFTFHKGFLKGLLGNIYVGEQNKRCLFIFKADWQGPHSKIPDRVFSLFIDILGEKMMATLFRISRTL